MFDVGPEQMLTVAGQGLLLSLDSHMDELSNFQEAVEAWSFESEIEFVTAGDGMLYGFPGMQEIGIQPLGWIYRQDILNQLDMAAPSNLEELTAYLEAANQAMEESAGFTSMFKTNLLMKMVAPMFGTLGGWDLQRLFYFDETSEEWVFAPSSAEWREMLTYMNDLVERGLMDDELFTSDNDQIRARFVNAETPAFVHWVAGAENFTGLAQEQGHDIQYEPYLPPEGPAGRKLPGAKRWSKLTVLNAELAENDAKLAAALRLMNYLYSKEAAVALNWGTEGETYETRDGGRVFTDVVINENGVYDQEKAKRDYGLGIFAHRTTQDFLLKSLSPSIREYQEQVAAEDDILADLPENLKVSAEKREDFDLIETPVRDYVDEMTLRFIYGDADIETEWDAYVQRVRELGVDRLTDMYDNLDATEF